MRQYFKTSESQESQVLKVAHYFFFVKDGKKNPEPLAERIE